MRTVWNALSLIESEFTFRYHHIHCSVFLISLIKTTVFSIRTFSQTVGTFDELKKYLQSYVDNLARDDKKRNAK